MTSWKTPTPKQVDAAFALLARVGQYRYFFDRLENPLWIVPLRQKNLFATPPRAVANDKDGTVEHQPWPASRYLVRMSAIPEAHADIVDTVLSMADTDNVIVHWDLLKIAGNLPPAASARLAGVAETWIRGGALLSGDRAAANLIVHLANGREAKAALRLARVLFQILPPKPSPAGDTWPRDVQTRMDASSFGDLLVIVRQPLVDAAGVTALQTFIGLLEQAIDAARPAADRGEAEDYSYVWLPAIPEKGDTGDHDVRHSLVRAVRDSAFQLSTTDEGFRSSLSALLRSKSRVLRRIALVLLRKSSNVHSIKETLGSRELFDELAFRREYALLLRDFFSEIGTDLQSQLLAWIAAGPRGIDVDDEYRQRWQLEMLNPLAGKLPTDAQHLFEELSQKYGTPKPPDLIEPRFEVWVGPKAPKTPEELKSLSDDDLIELLKTWQAPAERFSATPEGLGRTLTGVIAENPERLSDLAPRFVDVPPTYVRAALQGFNDAVRQGRAADWAPILGLSDWVLRQPFDYTKERDAKPFEADPGWTWARRVIASLINSGLEAKVGEIPLTARTALWGLIERLTEDPDPDPATESKYQGSNMDPPTMSLNTTRGEAMHATVRYALWIQRASDDADKFSFDETPEVRTVLDAHLSTDRDPSLAVRSVYGQWFPWLVLLDRKWARENVSRIFDAESEDYWNAAWNTYVTFSRPYDNVVEVMQKQYWAAVLKLSEAQPLAKDRDESPTRLAHHLVVLYGRGRPEAEPLLTEFFKRAPQWLRGDAIGHIGWSLGEGGEIPEDVISRFQSLWERRRELAEREPAEFSKELSSFGSWASVERFPAAWVLGELLRVLPLVDELDRDHAVMERLAKEAASYPVEATRVATLMVQRDVGWGITGWAQELETVLKAAMASTTAEARNQAQELIDLLGRLGHLSFRALL